jgi:hypothetical protein
MLRHATLIHLTRIRRIAAGMKACRIHVKNKVGEEILSIAKKNAPQGAL